MSPVISVVIPLYNKENAIASTLNSVLVQSVGVPFEIVIIDDGSTDRSADIVMKMAEADDRIRYFKQPNGGPGAARNTGRNMARGEWVMFLDADDLMLPGGLAALYRTAVKYTEVNFVCANFLLDGARVQFPCIADRLVKDGFRGWVLRELFPCQGTYMFRKQGIPDFCYNDKTRRYEDAELLFDYFRKREPIATSSAFVMVYRTAYAAASGGCDIDSDFVGHMKFEGKSFWEKIALGGLLLEHRRIYPEIMKKYRAYSFWAWIAWMISVYVRIRNRLFRYLISRKQLAAGQEKWSA